MLFVSAAVFGMNNELPNDSKQSSRGIQQVVKTDNVDKLNLARAENRDVTNIDQQNGIVDTPLMKAIEARDMSMVERLVSHGANVDQEHLGSYPVFQAFYSMQADIMKYLVENGADLNLKDFQGFTILRAAQEELKKINLCLSQLDKGDVDNFCEDLNYEMKEHNLDVYGAKSLFYHYRSFVESIIQYLKDHGAKE